MLHKYRIYFCIYAAFTSYYFTKANLMYCFDRLHNLVPNADDIPYKSNSVDYIMNTNNHLMEALNYPFANAVTV